MTLPLGLSPASSHSGKAEQLTIFLTPQPSRYDVNLPGHASPAYESILRPSLESRIHCWAADVVLPLRPGKGTTSEHPPSPSPQQKPNANLVVTQPKAKSRKLQKRTGHDEVAKPSPQPLTRELRAKVEDALQDALLKKGSRLPRTLRTVQRKLRSLLSSPSGTLSVVNQLELALASHSEQLSPGTSMTGSATHAKYPTTQVAPCSETESLANITSHRSSPSDYEVHPTQAFGDETREDVGNMLERLDSLSDKKYELSSSFHDVISHTSTPAGPDTQPSPPPLESFTIESDPNDDQYSALTGVLSFVTDIVNKSGLLESHRKMTPVMMDVLETVLREVLSKILNDPVFGILNCPAQTSPDSSRTNSTRSGNRHSQNKPTKPRKRNSQKKRKRDSGEGYQSNGSGSEDDGDSHTRNAKGEPQDTPPRRLKCPYYQRHPHLHQATSSCAFTSYRTMNHLKLHLDRVHTKVPHCECCFTGEICMRTKRILDTVKLSKPPFSGETAAKKWDLLFKTLFGENEEPLSPYEEVGMSIDEERCFKSILIRKLKEKLEPALGSLCAELPELWDECRADACALVAAQQERHSLASPSGASPLDTSDQTPGGFPSPQGGMSNLQLSPGSSYTQEDAISMDSDPYLTGNRTFYHPEDSPSPSQNPTHGPYPSLVFTPASQDSLCISPSQSPRILATHRAAQHRLSVPSIPKSSPGMQSLEQPTAPNPQYQQAWARNIPRDFDSSVEQLYERDRFWAVPTSATPSPQPLPALVLPPAQMMSGFGAPPPQQLPENLLQNSPYIPGPTQPTSAYDPRIGSAVPFPQQPRAHMVHRAHEPAHHALNHALNNNDLLDGPYGPPMFNVTAPPDSTHRSFHRTKFYDNSNGYGQGHWQ